MESLRYHPGFGSDISSEALPGALPVGQVRSVCSVPLIIMKYCISEQPSDLSLWSVL